MNMKHWLKEQKKSDVKKGIPILSFPSTQLMQISVIDLISDSGMQSKGMEMIADRCDMGASVGMMDLSVEAEAFGAKIRVEKDEVPTVIGRLVKNVQDMDALKVPKVGEGRTGIYVESIEKAVKMIKDRPVFAGVIGPFSLAGRLMDMTEIMVNCYVEPDFVHALLEKATLFLIEYIKSYNAVGANGIMMAEPAAGLLSPELNEAFSVPYVKRIVDAVSSEDFILIYHNCGNVLPLIDSILETGAAAYHFGNAVPMLDVLKRMPEHILTMGNVDPATQFRNGTPDSVKIATRQVLEECASYNNFVISSGCDIPPLASWKNIDAFFETVKAFYQGA